MSQAAKVTSDKVRGAIQVIVAVAEAIQELGEVPSGHLYAQLMSHLTLDQFLRIVEALKNSGLVREQNHLLTWIGPPKPEKS